MFKRQADFRRGEVGIRIGGLHVMQRLQEPPAEVPHPCEALAELRDAVKGKTVTLVTATKALDYSHAAVLREVLRKAR